MRVRVQVWTSIDLLTGNGLENWLFMQILEKDENYLVKGVTLFRQVAS